MNDIKPLRPWPPKVEPNRITEVVGPWTRRVVILPAWSQRAHGPKKIDYGIRDVELQVWLTRGQSGIVWEWSTGWHWKDFDRFDYLKPQSGPGPGSVEIHSPVPQWEGHETRPDCTITGGACYTDVGFGLATVVFKAMLTDGLEGVWKELEAIWTNRVGGKLA